MRLAVVLVLGVGVGVVSPAAADDETIPAGTNVDVSTLGLLDGDVGELYASLYCAPGTQPCELPAQTLRLHGPDGTAVDLRWVLIAFEHEGIENFHHREIVVLLGAPGAGGAPTVVHAISQFHHAAYDNGDEFTQTERQRVIDLDRDGIDELCIETWNDDRDGFIGRAAFRVDAGALVAVPTLDKKCPRRGYQMFVPVVGDDDPAWTRRRHARAHRAKV